MNEKELVEAALSRLTDAAREDVALPADRKVALFPSLPTFGGAN